MMTRYGQRNAMHVPEFVAKQMKTSFGFKDFLWPSGAVTKYQGFEHFLYKRLLKTHTETDIITDRTQIPSFEYQAEDGINCVFYPDAMVGTTIYEVKSVHTYKLHSANVIKKCEAVALKQQYTMELFIFESESKFFRHQWLPSVVKYLFVSPALKNKPA